MQACKVYKDDSYNLVASLYLTCGLPHGNQSLLIFLLCTAGPLCQNKKGCCPMCLTLEMAGQVHSFPDTDKLLHATTHFRWPHHA